MQNRQVSVFCFKVLVLSFLTLATFAVAAEKIIQHEMISFEKCLNVITTSESKLSIAPEIKDVSNQKRVALFKLVDGTLTITCDGQEGSVTVSTNTN